jgi:hypothetical protein
MGSTLQGVVLCDKLLGRVAFGADAGGGFLVLKIPPKKNKQSLKYTINIISLFGCSVEITE